MAGTWIGSTLLAAVCYVAAVPDPVPFKTLDAGLQSGIEQARNVVVRMPDEWKVLCAQYAEGRKCPAVDFARSMVVAVFLGTRPTAGYAAEITRVERDGDTLVVTWREKKPGPDEMVAQMMTAPYLLVTIDRGAGPVNFVRAR